MMNNETPAGGDRADTPDDLENWEPSIRACARSTSYEHYLALMGQMTRELQHELTDEGNMT